VAYARQTGEHGFRVHGVLRPRDRYASVIGAIGGLYTRACSPCGPEFFNGDTGATRSRTRRSDKRVRLHVSRICVGISGGGGKGGGSGEAAGGRRGGARSINPAINTERASSGNYSRDSIERERERERVAINSLIFHSGGCTSARNPRDRNVRGTEGGESSPVTTSV